VTHTEIGHLFEHILLEYLCLAKLDSGEKSAEFCGCTTWNWKREPKGMFHIEITKTQGDSLYFARAYQQSVQLLSLITSTSNKS
jgi:hypothetical protein